MPDIFKMRSYFQTLRVFTGWKDPNMINSKLIHVSAKVPNFAVFKGLSFSGRTEQIILLNPRTNRESLHEITSGWYFWDPYDESKFLALDTDLVNTCIECINTILYTKPVFDPYKYSAEIGTELLNLILSSHRKEDIHVGSNGQG